MTSQTVPLLSKSAWIDTYRAGFEAWRDRGEDHPPYSVSDPKQADACEAWLRGTLAARPHARKP